MAKRYRYAFIKKRESRRGKLSLGLAIASVCLFLAAMAADIWGSPIPHLTGGLCLLGALFSLYGFFAGILSFSEKNRGNATGIGGSIACGIIVILWLGLYLTGV